MSYLTGFKISIVDDSEITLEKLAEIFSTQVDEGFVLDTEENKVVTDEDICFYAWEMFMSSLSKKYPYTVFLIEGMGEEKLDIWRAFYFQGKQHYQKAEIKFPNPPQTLLADMVIASKKEMLESK